MERMKKLICVFMVAVPVDEASLEVVRNVLSLLPPINLRMIESLVKLLYKVRVKHRWWRWPLSKTDMSLGVGVL